MDTFKSNCVIVAKIYSMVAILFKYYALQCFKPKLNLDIDILKDCQIGLF